MNQMPYNPSYLQNMQPMPQQRSAFTPTATRNDPYMQMAYFGPSPAPLPQALQSLKEQLPPLNLPPMLPPLPSAMAPPPKSPEGMPAPDFGNSTSPSTTGILLNEAYLPPVPLTSYLHSMGPFQFSNPFAAVTSLTPPHSS